MTATRKRPFEWTAAAKAGCSFAVRTLFSLSVAGFVSFGWFA